MDQRIIYSKTGKGVLEIKNKAGKLSRDLARVLTLVDGKSAVEDLISKSKLSDADIERSLKQLEEGGYIKEFSTLSNSISSASSAGSSSYVDDLDFTSSLSPGKRVYSNSATEMRARESAEREKAEAEARRKREQAEQAKKNQAAQQAREEAIRLARIEAERKAKEAAALKVKQQADLKAKQQAAEMAQTTRDLAKILEAERQALEKSSAQRKVEQERKAVQDAERQAREEVERKRLEEEEQKRREEEERKRREEEERKKRWLEEQERKRREEEERKRREEEERKRREEEERKRLEEEERKRREEEEERRRREEEDRRREEEDRRREEEDRRRREGEDRKRREEEDRRRRDEGDRQREEEEARWAREEEERQRREEEESRKRKDDDVALPSFDLGSFDLPTPSESAGSAETNSTSSFSFDSPSEATPEVSGFGADSFTADFDRQQELRKKQEEEEDRRRNEAEEARLSMERAQREEDARLEAERRVAMEAEMRARVEQERTERTERERQKREEYERKIQQEEERKRRDAEQLEREEIQRKEADRAKREEDLAKRRQRTEESDRRRAEIKALQRSGKIRSPMDRVRPFIIGLVALVAIGIGAIHVMPMSGYIPKVEKLVSENIGEPVTIGSMSVSMVSGLQFKFESINIGTTQDVTLNSVVVSPQLGSLFGDNLVLDSIAVDGGTVVKEVLPRLSAWRIRSAADPHLRVRSMRLRSIRLDTRSVELPPMDVDIRFGADGKVSSARIASSDGRLSGDITDRGDRVEVAITANNWTSPLGSQLRFTDFSGKGVATGSSLTLYEWDATVYGGQAKGKSELKWGGRWSLTSDFEFARIDAEELLAALSDTAKVSGRASGKGRLSAESGNAHELLDRPNLEAEFSVQKGTLDGVDLVTALQTKGNTTQGGSTKFEEITGTVSISNRRISYSNVNLVAGILSAQSYFNLSENQDVIGRVSIALSSPAQRLSTSVNISGTLKGVILRR